MVADIGKAERDKVLTEDEIAAVVADLRPRGRRSANARVQLAIFRLATSYGLRASEVAGMQMGDARLDTASPVVEVRPEVGKGGKGRTVPADWDHAALDDLFTWADERWFEGAAPDSPFVCRQAVSSYGRPFSRYEVCKRFVAACAVLGRDRQSQVNANMGRHSFISHAMRSRHHDEVRRAAGHASLDTTGIYTHVAVDDDGSVGNVFG